MKKRILLSTLLFLCIIVLSKSIFGIDINIGETHSFSFGDLQEGPNIATKITGASSSNDNVVEIETVKTGIIGFRAISEVKATGKKAGTAKITLYGTYEEYKFDPVTNLQVKITHTIAKTYNLVVKDPMVEAEKEKEEMNNAYKSEPNDNATAEEIKDFIISDQKNSNGENIKKVSKNKLGKWLETVNDLIASDRNHYKQPKQYGAIKDAIQEMIDTGKVSDSTKHNLDETYKLKEDSYDRIIYSGKGAADGKPRNNVFNNDVLVDIEQYKPGHIDNTSAKKIETITGTILKTITNIGIVISVVMLAVLGIKYMLGSVEEKADYKQGLVPYAIGAFVLFGISAVVKVVMGIGSTINNI